MEGEECNNNTMMMNNTAVQREECSNTMEIKEEKATTIEWKLWEKKVVVWWEKEVIFLKWKCGGVGGSEKNLILS